MVHLLSLSILLCLPAACAGSHADPGAEGTGDKARLVLRGETLNVEAGAAGERAAT